MVDDVLYKGVKLIIGNVRKNNLFYLILLDNVNVDMKIVWEELFGLVFLIIRVKDIN